jgi:hypothetical protein
MTRATTPQPLKIKPHQGVNGHSLFIFITSLHHPLTTLAIVWSAWSAGFKEANHNHLFCFPLNIDVHKKVQLHLRE